MGEVKNGWIKAKLIDLGTLQTGTTPSTKDRNNYGEHIAFIKPAHFHKNGSIDLNNMGLSKQGLSKARLIPKRSILMVCIGATIGKTGYINDAVSCNQQINSFTPKDGLSTKYFYYLLSSDYFTKQVFREASQATIPIINKTKWGNLRVTYPESLAEQKQIVALLDQAFAAIDQAKANIEKNIQNAQELFQSKLNDIFSQTGEGWEEKRLGDVCVIERGSSPRPIKKYITDSEDGVHWIKIGDVGKNDKYVRTTKQKITKKGAEKSRFVDIGDFILSNSMSFGRAYIMAIQGYIHDGWFVLRIPKEINSDYFWQLLSSPYLKDQFNQLAAGAIVKNISGDLVKKAIVPIPPMEKQIEIFNETNLLNKRIEEIKANYQNKLTNLEELKKSILQKAFNGELT